MHQASFGFIISILILPRIHVVIKPVLYTFFAFYFEFTKLCEKVYRKVYI